MTKTIKIPIEAAAVVEDRAKHMISAEELQKRLATDEKIYLIDVRSEPEFRMMHLEGATLATRPLVEEIFTKWPKDRALVIYDHFGKESINAVKALVSREFTNAKALAGGLDLWSQSIDPLMPRY
jgi:rhodanese-related sulfurtransferase